MKLKPDGIMIEMSEQEARDINASYEELCWHMQNLLVEIGSTQNNKLRTALYCAAIKALAESYLDALIAHTCEVDYRKPNLRLAVERAILSEFVIPHYADILPRTKVRVVATGNEIGRAHV